MIKDRKGHILTNTNRHSQTHTYTHPRHMHTYSFLQITDAQRLSHTEISYTQTDIHKNKQKHRDIHRSQKHRDLGCVHDTSFHHNSSFSFCVIMIISYQLPDYSPRYIFISHLKDMSLNTWNMYHPLYCFIYFHLKLQTLNIIVFF